MSNRHEVMNAVVESGLVYDMDGDSAQEIGIFALVNVPIHPASVGSMARSVNESQEHEGNEIRVTVEGMLPYAGWSIFQERMDGTRFVHSYGDDADEALEAYKAMQRTHWEANELVAEGL